MMKYIKKIISIILIVAMLIDTIPRVQARTTVSFGEKVTNQGSSGGGGGHNGEQGVLLGDSVIVGTSTKNYSCSWEYTLTDNTTDIVSVYDMNNNDIIKDGFIIPYF